MRLEFEANIALESFNTGVGVKYIAVLHIRDVLFGLLAKDGFDRFDSGDQIHGLAVAEL